MSVSWRSFDSAYVSDELRDVVRRRVRELGGLSLLALAAALGVALATWSAQDPSLTHATKSPVRNMLGLPGAASADLLMQLLGLASIALLVPVAVWAWRLLSRRPLGRERLRIAAWVIGILATAAFASCLPATSRWPLPTGLGGVIGDALLRGPGFVLGTPLSGVNTVTMASVSGAIALIAV